VRVACVHHCLAVWHSGTCCVLASTRGGRSPAGSGAVGGAVALVEGAPLGASPGNACRLASGGANVLHRPAHPNRYPPPTTHWRTRSMPRPLAVWFCACFCGRLNWHVAGCMQAWPGTPAVACMVVSRPHRLLSGWLQAAWSLVHLQSGCRSKA
jgi:hypothetical protein